MKIGPKPRFSIFLELQYLAIIKPNKTQLKEIDQIKPNQQHQIHSKPNQTILNQSKQNENQPIQTKTNQTEPNQTKLNLT